MNVKETEQRIRELLAERNYYRLDYEGEWLDKVFAAYCQPHRYFHTLQHLLSICESIREASWDDEIMASQLLITALFHDVVWYPQDHDSEDKSIEAFDFIMSRLGNPLPTKVADLVKQTIKATETQDTPTEMAARFHQYDCQVIIRGNYVDLLEYEFQIFREFQYLNMVDYRKGRSAFFQRFPKRFPKCKATIDFLVEYLERRRPRVGIYAGTFNPFHIGHLSILEKAEKMFDKVIVVVGINPAKNVQRDVKLEKILPFHEVVYCDQLMVDLMEQESKFCDVTLVRGLRNGYDLDYEMNQLCYMQEMRPGTQSVYIPCDKRLEHVSSSMLNGLQRFNVGDRDNIYYPKKYDYYKQSIEEMFG